MLIDRNMKKTELAKRAHIYPQTMANMGKGEPVSMDTLGRICKVLECQVGDIIEYIPDES